MRKWWSYLYQGVNRFLRKSILDESSTWQAPLKSFVDVAKYLPLTRVNSVPLRVAKLSLLKKFVSDCLEFLRILVFDCLGGINKVLRAPSVQRRDDVQ